MTETTEHLIYANEVSTYKQQNTNTQSVENRE